MRTQWPSITFCLVGALWAVTLENEFALYSSLVRGSLVDLTANIQTLGFRVSIVIALRRFENLPKPQYRYEASTDGAVGNYGIVCPSRRIAFDCSCVHQTMPLIIANIIVGTATIDNIRHDGYEQSRLVLRQITRQCCKQWSNFWLSEFSTTLPVLLSSWYFWNATCENASTDTSAGVEDWRWGNNWMTVRQ